MLGCRCSLTRIKTGEKIDITKSEFLLGRNPTVLESGYCIRDNRAISRIHAKIFKRGSRYYIKDRNSTNGTSINGKLIASCVEVPLFNGDKVTLANEDFEFQLKLEGMIDYCFVEYEYLIRVKTNEKIYISGSEFLLGKGLFLLSKKPRYRIKGNVSISCLHATILKLDGKHYIRDEKSRNGTCVNNKSIPSGVEFLIKDGDEIVLANETFKFACGWQ